MELHWDHLLDLIGDYLNQASDHLYLMSPFISKGVLAHILPKTTSATIISSWNPNFLAQHPESLHIYNECLRRGNTALYINDKLHAKLYAYDLTKEKNGALVGSANLTRKALGIGVEPNYEVLCKLENINPRERIYFQRILSDSILVTDEIYETYRDWVEICIEAEKFTGVPNVDLSTIKQLLVTDLPLTDSPSRLWNLKMGSVEFEWWEEDAMIHDIAIFGGENAVSIEEFYGDLRNRFENQVFVTEFLKIITKKGIYFGRIKEWVQKKCHDVPTPKRRELTETVQSLLKWVVELFPDQYEIIRPHHSECLRLKN